jgi:hypothetical protein
MNTARPRVEHVRGFLGGWAVEVITADAVRQYQLYRRAQGAEAATINREPDWVIQAQLGHVSPSMMKTYSHPRRKALDAAAAVLEPVLATAQRPGNTPSDEDRLDDTRDGPVTSHVASQTRSMEGEANEMIKESGSSDWIRTSNPPVNRTMRETSWVSVACVFGRFR